MQARKKSWYLYVNVGYWGKRHSICWEILLVYLWTSGLYRMPIQYIIGEWDFRDITLKLVPPIFIPRPETEILVDFVLKRLNALQANSYEILEIGCGSGAISLALTHASKKVHMRYYIFIDLVFINICRDKEK